MTTGPSWAAGPSPEAVAADAELLAALGPEPEARRATPGLPGFDLRRVLEGIRGPDFEPPDVRRVVQQPAVAGFGVFLAQDGVARAAIVSYDGQPGSRFRTIEESPNVHEAIKGLRDRLRSDPLVLELPPPVLHAGCGSELWAGNPGSAGPLVSRGAEPGILTAGHVAPRVGEKAYLDNADWGTVAFTTDGTTNPVDVAFITQEAGPAASPRGPHPLRTRRPELGDLVRSVGAMTCRAANTMGIMPFQWFPALGRNLADVMITAESISRPGDSGALVVMENEEADMVGLIVGGDRRADTYTSVQLADVILATVGCVLR